MWSLNGIVCIIVVVLSQIAAIFVYGAGLPFFPLPADTNAFAKPPSVVLAISNESYNVEYSPTDTQRKFWLSTDQISVMREAVIISNDAIAAGRLFAYYMLSKGDSPQGLRWLTMTAYIGGVTEAVENIELTRKAYHTQDLVQVFRLSNEQIDVLNEAVVSNCDASAAFRLSVYHGFVVGDADAKLKWMRKAAALGCHGAEFYLSIIDTNNSLPKVSNGTE